MRKTYAGLMVVLLLLAGCASGRPGWTDSGKSKDYPANRYLIGIGTAADLGTAKDRARANLAKIFSVKISEVTEDLTSHARKSGAAGTEYINEARVERLISSRTEHVLTGVQIAQTWQGPKTRAYYVLAVLPRLQASNNLRQEIDRLDRTTRTYVKRARNEGDTLRKVRAASIALDAQLARQAYQRTLRVIDRSGRGEPPKWEMAKLSSDLGRLLRRVRIAAQVNDDTTGTLQTSVSGALAIAGFLVSKDEAAEFVLDARLRMEDIGLRDGWYWIRGVLEIKLTERVSKRARGNTRWTIKAAGHSTGDARQRIANKADALLKRQLKSSIIKFSTR